MLRYPDITESRKWLQLSCVESMGKRPLTRICEPGGGPYRASAWASGAGTSEEGHGQVGSPRAQEEQHSW